MEVITSQWLIITHLTLLLSFSLSLCRAYDDLPPPNANLSTIWTNNNSDLKSYPFTSHTLMRFVIFNNNTNSPLSKPGIGCGFYQKGTPDEFYFIIFYNDVDTSFNNKYPRVLWTANRNNPVRNNATLELTSMGDLVLKDVDGTHVWSTNTSGSSTSGMKLTEMGNLVLHDAKNVSIWQSFDHPTDTWILSQKLAVGQRLIASDSDDNSSAGPFYTEFQEDGLYAFIYSSPPQSYAKVTTINSQYLTVDMNTHKGVREPGFVFYAKNADTYFLYVRLESDGHLRVFTFVNGLTKIGEDIFKPRSGDCGYPTVCGNYGTCTNGDCSCPPGTDGNTSYFKQTSYTKPSRGCVRTTGIDCKDLQLQYFVELENVDYFNFVTVHTNISTEGCKHACLKSCSCKAALFHYYDSNSSGNCSLQDNILSFMTIKPEKGFYSSTIFLKVQGSLEVPFSTQTTRKRKRFLLNIVAATFLGVFFLGIMMVGLFVHLRRRAVQKFSKMSKVQKVEDPIDEVSVPLKRFSFDDLNSATGNFSKKLGGGGFGSVFLGNFDDGTKIAVKRLDDLGQGRKEFLAEVETIGSIHHVNLVRLFGFCAENSHRLLVYEYMSNRSLDMWLFLQKEVSALNWPTRRSIILDVAKGLSYLHEECQKRIVHLDIKPQNILLDKKFNAKISDFGLARFIDRDESQVLTTMRGTRGYMAPEWFSNTLISEKVDVYSFGIVILEIICGRKNFDHSQQKESEHLLHLVKTKAEDDQLFLIDIVDKQMDDIQQYKEDVVNILKMAIWCLQTDCTKRPSMSMVVKVLEGVMEMDNITDFSFLSVTPRELPRDNSESYSSPLLASVLSGPR